MIKRRIKFAALAMAACMTGTLLPVLPVSAEAESGAYYLVDDDFMLPDPMHGGIEADYSGYSWDILEDGGAMQNYETQSGYVPMFLNDTSPEKRVVIRRTFERQDSSRVVAEYRTKFTDLSDGYGVSICSGDTEVIGLETINGQLYCGDTAVASGLAVNTEYGICIELDMDAKTANIFINGEKRLSDAELACSSIDNIRAYTSAAGVGKMTFAPVRIMRGYHLAEDFVSYKNGQSLPDSGGLWTPTGSKNAKIINNTSCPYDIYAIALADASVQSSSGIERSVDTLNGSVVFSFKTYSAQTIKNLNVELGGFKSHITNGVYYIKSYRGGNIKIKELPDNLWMSFRIEIDFAAGTAAVRINGKDVMENVRFANAGASADKVSFATGAGTTETQIQIDDIFIFDAPVYDGYYPSEPQKIEKSDNDVIVGMQSCNIWREGKHFGWDYISGYDKRIPYLGFYDDGNAEAKDWEIKYMVEHGVDFEMYCWFTAGGQGRPIKEPRYISYALHDGYFNSRYKDKMKFAIMWENSGYHGYSANPEANYASCLDDFKNNIVPYWIEYYFKDPNYLILDNKAVLSVYKADVMVSSFGEQNTRAALEYLNNEVKKIQLADGSYLDGVYLIGTASSTAAQYRELYRDYGFDAMYFYTYSQSGGGTAARQWNTTTLMKGVAEVGYIPTISMGYDASAWGRAAGTNITPAAMKELCQKLKERYFSKESYSSALDRMVLLDNWNEYGEGHFFMPTDLAGFGYLEAVGQVFGQPEHTDEKPRNTGRLGHLYDKNRIRDAQESYRLRGKLTAVKVWDFKNTTDLVDRLQRLGFSRGSSMTSLTLTSGVGLVGNSTGNDPQINSPAGLGIELTGNEVVHVRFKNPTSATRTQMFFKTTSASAYSEAASVWLDMPPNMTQCEDLYFDLSPLGNNAANANWTGTLDRLRFDPFDTTGEVVYELIEILRYDNTDIPSAPKFSAAAEYAADSGAVEFTFQNPDYAMDCMAFAAEYDGNTVTDVQIAEERVIEVGETTLLIPIEVKEDRKYKFGAWDKDMKPIIVPAGEIN